MNFREIERRIMVCPTSELDLSECALEDDVVAQVVPLINRHKDIIALNLSFNNLSQGVVPSLLQLEHVQELNLKGNNIDQIDPRLTQFAAVNLRSNNIPAPCIESFLKTGGDFAAQFGFEGNPHWQNPLPERLETVGTPSNR